MICDCGTHSWKPITRGFVTFASPEDDDILMRYKWHAGIDSKNYVAVRRAVSRKGGLERREERLSRNIANPPAGFVVDHIDGNSLNNHRDNLRVCLPSENTMNARPRKGKNIPLKGVRKIPNGKFHAMITRSRKQYYLGTFETAEAAHQAYCEKAIALHGEFARLM